MEHFGGEWVNWTTASRAISDMCKRLANSVSKQVRAIKVETQQEVSQFRTSVLFVELHC